MAKRNLVSVLDAAEDLTVILDEAQRLKGLLKKEEIHHPLRSKTLAMIFEKPSTRTRISFEVGMGQLGGLAVYLNPQDLQLGRGETIEDTARVLSRYVDAILYRAYSHENMVRLAEAASVPVINGLDDLEHPCQIISDLFTIREARDRLQGLKLAYVGDGNNVCNSLLLGCALVGMDMSAACPQGYEPDGQILKQAKRIASEHGGRVEITTDPREAVRGADIVYTDVWVSMGMEEERGERERSFHPYQVNRELLEAADENVLVMHCLPAHRGQEITDEVIDSDTSLVWDQAENRLHVQKALLIRLIAAGR
ncbi:MAG: ornithine carbamoyltransferase [Thermoplasmata archaeon]